MGFYMMIFASAMVMWSAKAANMEDFKREFLGHLMGCAQKFPLTSAEMESLKNKEIPTGENAKCMIGCAYMKIGVIDDQGNFAVEAVKEISKKYFLDQKLATKADELVESCKEVNDAPVSDGNKGCERAVLLMKCTFEKGSEFFTTLGDE